MRTLEVINQELADAGRELEEAERLDSMLKDIEEQQNRCRQSLVQAKAVLEKEEQDVEEIERLSFTSFIARIKGQLKERTEQEHRDAVAAKARCDATSCNLDDLEQRSQALREERAQLGDPQSRYEVLLQEKEAVLLTSGADSASRLDEIGHRIHALDAQLREVGEAFSAGKSAAWELEQMSNELAKTADWDHLDLMDGENVHATIHKERLDSTRQQSEKACAALERLRRELWDVVFQNVPDVQLDDFTSFTDCLDEGIFEDLYVQEKFQRAQDCVTDALCEVEHALSLLQERQAVLQPQCDALKRERLELLK